MGDGKHAAGIAPELKPQDVKAGTANVVNSAKGDANYGENSALYASFGYIRKDDCKSGLTRAATNVVPHASAELKIAA